MSHKVISFHYTVKDSAGKVLDSSDGGDPMAFLSGHQQIIPGLEKELLTMNKGDEKSVTVAADEAYGPRNDEMIQEVPRTELPEELTIGQMFSVSTDDSGQPTHLVTVVSFDDETVKLDANHPLAGQDLSFDVAVTDIRDATAEEVRHGHAHGVGGHHH